MAFLFSLFRDVKKENKTRSGFSALISAVLDWNNQMVYILISIVIGQKSTNQIAQYMVESWRGFRTLLSTSETFGRPSGDFRRVFKHCRKWHSYNAKISGRLQIFTGVGGWWKPYLIPDQNGQSLSPFQTRNGGKTLPFGAAHTYRKTDRQKCFYLESHTINSISTISKWLIKVTHNKNS